MTVALLPIGELLRTWREQRRLSQLELATEAEVSQRHLSFIESGRAASEKGRYRLDREPSLVAHCKPAFRPNATSTVAIHNVRFTSIRDERAHPPSVAEPLSIGARMWYHDTTYEAGKAQP